VKPATPCTAPLALTRWLAPRRVGPDARP